MAATGKTTNYNIPIYNAGDTVNDLVSYNTAMTIVDTELKANSVATGVVEDDVAGLTSTVEKHTEDITALDTAVKQARGSAQGALNQIQEILNPKRLHLTPSPAFTGKVMYTDNMISYRTFYFTKTNYDALPEITIGSNTWKILGKIDNANPLNLRPGDSIETLTLGIDYVTDSFHTVFNSNVNFYYDGTNTYHILLLNGRLVNQVLLQGCAVMANLQPKEL